MAEAFSANAARKSAFFLALAPDEENLSDCLRDRPSVPKPIYEGTRAFLRVLIDFSWKWVGLFRGFCIAVVWSGKLSEFMSPEMDFRLEFIWKFSFVKLGNVLVRKFVGKFCLKYVNSRSTTKFHFLSSADFSHPQVQCPLGD